MTVLLVIPAVLFVQEPGFTLLAGPELTRLLDQKLAKDRNSGILGISPLTNSEVFEPEVPKKQSEKENFLNFLENLIQFGNFGNCVVNPRSIKLTTGDLMLRGR